MSDSSPQNETKPEKAEKPKRKHSDRYLLRQLFGYMLVKKKLIGIAMVTVLLGSFLDIIGPYLLKIAIDDHVLKGKTDGLLELGALYALVFLLSGVTIFLRIWLLGVVGQSAIYELRKDTFERLQDLGMDYVDAEPSGEIMARMSNDVDKMEPMLRGEVISAAAALIMFFAMFGIMFFFSPLLTLLSFVILPVFVALALLERRIVRPRWRAWREVSGRVTATMQEHISGARISQSFARREANVAEFDTLNKEFYEAEMSAIRAGAWIGSLYDVVAVCGTMLVVYFGGMLVLNEKAGISAGVLVLFLAYHARFLMPLFVLTSLYGNLQTAFASLERIMQLKARATSIPEHPDAKPLICTAGKIVFENVTFKYREELPPVLDDFSLTINPGTCLAIVGETGAGKTTVVNLVPRLYQYQSGQIRIDDQLIEEVTLSSLRENIGVVPQTPFLFSESIRDNLCYGEDLPDDELNSVLSLVGADFVHKLRDGLDTIVGERGGRLSMGQRQLISFARALITNPRVLILDEATSSIDPQAELQIQRALRRILAGRTSVIIAHRLSTVREADRIIVMDGGRIIEDGTYQELLKLKGMFNKLHKLQFRDQEI